MVEIAEMVEIVEIISTWTPPKVEMVEITSYHVISIVKNNSKIQDILSRQPVIGFQ